MNIFEHKEITVRRRFVEPKPVSNYYNLLAKASLERQSELMTAKSIEANEILEKMFLTETDNEVFHERYEYKRLESKSPRKINVITRREVSAQQIGKLLVSQFDDMSKDMPP